MQQVNNNKGFALPLIFGSFMLMYLGAEILGNTIYIQPENVAALWPASGIFVGALLLSRYRLWPAFVLLALLSQYITDVVIYHRPMFLFLIFASANTLEALAGAWLVRRFVGLTVDTGNLRQVLILLTCAGFIGTALGASIGSAGVALLFDNLSYWHLWQLWWLSDLVGVLVLAPVVIAIIQNRDFRLPQFRSAALFELGALFLSVFLIARFVFGNPPEAIRSSLDFPYLVIPLLIWAALRFTPTIAALSVLMVTVISVWNSFQGFGPFVVAIGNVYQQVLALQSFIAVTAIGIAIMAAVVTQQRRQDQKTFESEQRHRLTLEVVGSGGWDFDIVNGKATITDRLLEQLGYLAGEIEIDPEWIENNTYPGDYSRMRDAYLDHVKGNTEFYKCELRLKHKQGHYLWMLMRGAAVSRDEQGKVSRIIGANFDIEDRKRAEQALVQSEHQFRDLVEGSIQGIFIHSAERILFANQAFAEIFGYPGPKQILALDSRFLLYAEYEHDRLKAYGKQRFGGEKPPEQYEFDGLKRDGSIIHLSTIARLIEWKGETALQIVLVDITEQRRTAEAMQARELHYRSLFDSAPVALFESNWSKGMALFKRLRDQGVEDIYDHLKQHPELIRRRSDMGELTNVNQEALRIYNAEDKQSLIAWIQDTPLEEIPAGLIERMVQHESGHRRDTQESNSLRFSGEPFAALVTSQVVSDDPQDWTHMLTMELDVSTQKEAEALLAESEQRFRDLVEGSVQGIVIFNFDWELRFVNLALADFLGYPDTQSILKMGNWGTFLAPHDLPRMQDYRARRLRGGPVPSQYETDLIKIDGSVVNVMMSVRSIEWQGESAIQCTLFDLTERKQAESALHESEARLTAFMENTPDVIAIKDVEGKYVYVNRQYEKLHNITNAEMKGQYPNFIQSEEDSRLIESEDRLARENQQARKLYQRSDVEGVDQHWFVTRFPILTADGEYIGVGGISTEISELKAAEQALRESEVRYRRLFDSAPVSLWEQDWSGIKQLVDDLKAKGIKDISSHLKKNPDLIGRRADVSKLIDVNTETLRLYGATDKTVFRDRVQNAPWQERDSGLLDRISGFLNGQSRVVVESKGTRMDATQFSIRITTEIVSDDLEDWSQIYTSEQDITEEELSAARLSAYRDELRLLAGQMSLAEESERRRIASDLHDGTVQNLVLARMNILAIKKSLRSKRSLATADAINDLLENSLTETRSMIFDLSPPVLYELGLMAAIEWLADQFKQRTGITASFEVDGSEVLLSHELKVVLFQAMRELLVNVAKHAQAKRVRLAWTKTASRLELSVQDDGIGFDIADVGNRSSSEGGFGLFSLRERLGLLGANISFQSSDSGTCITLAAPLDSNPA